MRNLAIECSGLVPSIGVFDDGQPLSLETLNSEQGSVQRLAPAIEQLLGETNSGPSNSAHPIQYICVTVGPGSFTGLRVGLSTAKMLGLAWGIPLVGVDTLHVISEAAAAKTSLGDEESLIVPVLNAFRGQVFSAVWKLESSNLHLKVPSHVIDATDWVKQPVADIDWEGDVVVVGPGLAKYHPDPQPNVRVAPASHWEPQVQSLARIGAEEFQRGHQTSALELLPNYVRASAAEEQLRKSPQT